MSNESTPILSGAIPTFEAFMTRWEKVLQDHPRLEKYIKPGLEWAYQYYGRMDRTRAYIITMCKRLSSYPIMLIIVCSPEPYHTYDVDQ
jgi:hypothetical protein